MGDDRNCPGRERPANDNRPPDGEDAGLEASAAERLDAVVLTIAPLIGRRMAREDFEKAMHAANDNAPPTLDGSGRESDDTE